MIEKTLEFRGITLSHLCMYFEELGGAKLNDEFPVCFKGANWNAEILSEEELTFTKIFKVNAVHIRFMAETEDALADLLKKYRYKTTRIGG